MPATLLLVRHGETEWNRERRFQGHADPPLNSDGRAQAITLADTLAGDGVTAIYTSPLARARETAEIVGARLGLRPRAEARLMEIDVGSWTGLTAAELEQRFPTEWAKWRDEVRNGWTGGETYDQLTHRVLAAAHEIGERHPDESVLLVSHGGALRVTLAHAAGVDVVESRRIIPPLANCSLHRVTLEDGRFRVD